MSVYAYFNEVLDGNPSVTRLVVDAVDYPVIAGPAPVGEQDISARVTVEKSVEDDTFNRGYDAQDTLVVLFRY